MALLWLTKPRGVWAPPPKISKEDRGLGTNPTRVTQRGGFAAGYMVHDGGESGFMDTQWDFFRRASDTRSKGAYHRVHTEWQRPLSGVHFIMMEKYAQAGEGGGCTPTPFYSIYHHVQSCHVRSQLSGQIHSPFFISTNMYMHSVGHTNYQPISVGGFVGFFTWKGSSRVTIKTSASLIREKASRIPCCLDQNVLEK